MQISRRFLRSLFTSTAWWIGVALSLALYLLVERVIEEKARAEFEYHAENAQIAIQNRLRSYIDVLRGTAALFHTSDKVTREQFHAYVSQLKLEQTFPGIRNLNFARFVRAEEKEAFIASVRNDRSLNPEGYPAFDIEPPGDRPQYHVLTYLEPMDSASDRFGFDMGSLAFAARALAASRDNGQLMSSGRLIHIAGPNHHIGLAMRIPLYRPGMPTDTLQQRRVAYYGSVGAGFDVSQLMVDAIEPKVLSYLRARLYDVGQVDGTHFVGTQDPERLLFDTALALRQDTEKRNQARNLFVSRVSMTVGSRLWETEFSAPKTAMMSSIDRMLGGLVLIGGLIGSTLLYSIYYSLITARRRASELARDMTRDLRTSEASLAEAQHMARLGSWTLEPISGKMDWSAQTYRILGMNRTPEGPTYTDLLRRIDADDRKRVREGLEHSITTGEEFSTEHRIVQPDGGVRWVQTISRIGHDEHNLLLRGTLMDITDRKQTVEALKRSQELLRELTAHQDRVKEEERKRIAREIHDELGQTLLALRIDVSMLDARTAKSHPRLNEKVRGALNHLDATVKTIRTIINNLRPAVLDLGLTAAIEWQVAEFRRRSGITCELLLDERDLQVDDARATSLFRILQESLTNVIRHANATHVVVELYRQGKRLMMKISDNGVGIYPENRKSMNSFGLVGVEERIHALNGEFHIGGAPGEGTTLTIYIPLDNDDSDEERFKLVDASS